MQSQLLTASALLEAGAGLALLLVPAALIEVAFGPATASAAAAGMARLAGAALLSLGSACWMARGAGRNQSSPIVTAMLVYNVVVIALVFAGILGSLGPLQFAAVVLHGTMAIWCARVLTDRPR